MSETAYFSRATLDFIAELKKNNRKPWFEKNKSRYTEYVRDAALRFIQDFRPLLQKISPEFNADARPVGGSLFRIYRDTRFSKDKSPYKTHLGIQFRHRMGKDVHAPGFYLHIEPGGSFVGVGIWHPGSAETRMIREGIAADPAGWKRVLSAKPFKDRFRLSGDSLVRPPKGFDPEHPLLEDLKRKDYIAVSPISTSVITGKEFPEELAKAFQAAAPLNRFLCKALDLPY